MKRAARAALSPASSLVSRPSQASVPPSEPRRPRRASSSTPLFLHTTETHETLEGPGSTYTSGPGAERWSTRGTSKSWMWTCVSNCWLQNHYWLQPHYFGGPRIYHSRLDVLRAVMVRAMDLIGIDYKNRFLPSIPQCGQEAGQYIPCLMHFRIEHFHQVLNSGSPPLFIDVLYIITRLIKI